MDIRYLHLAILIQTDCNLSISLCHYSVDFVLVNLLTSSITVFYWNENLLLFVPSNLNIQLTEQPTYWSIVSIVPSDYNLDGFLDLLVTIQVQSKSLLYSSSYVYKHLIYLFNGKSFSEPISLPDTFDELLILDYFGTMRVSFMGIPVQHSEPVSGNPISIFTLQERVDGVVSLQG